MAPSVSVVMSVYNDECYLRESVESILNQTFKDFEFIIVDDASSDGTADMLQGYAKRDKRIRLLTNSRNLGLTASLNRGLKIAGGSYIARQDGDDISLPKRFESQVDFLDSHPEVGVVGTWITKINENGYETVWRPPASPGLVRWFLLFGPCLAHPSVMFRRSLAENGSLYDSKIIYAQDYDLWVRLCSKTQIANLPKVLYLRRLHKGMISFKHHEQQEQTTVSVMQKALTNVQGKGVKTYLAKGLRRASQGEMLSSFAELQDVANLIAGSYKSFITQGTLDGCERAQIANDVVRRLRSLALSHARQQPAGASRVVLQSIRLEPWLFLATSLKMIFKFIVRTVGKNG